MASVDFFIQAVPSRMAHVKESIIPYMTSSVRVSVDSHQQGSWNALRSLLIHAEHSRSEYICILQDDLVPCKKLCLAVEHLVEVEPCHPLLLCNTVDVRIDPAIALSDKVWRQGFFNGVGTVWPKELLTGLPAWAEAAIPTDAADPWWTTESAVKFARFRSQPSQERVDKILRNGSDWRMALYTKAQGHKMIVTNPSLVDHIGFVSVAKPGTQNGACATWFLGDDDPFEIDWTKKDYT